MGLMGDLGSAVKDEGALQARNAGNIPLAASQKAQGVTGDQTSPWTRVGNTLDDTFGKKGEEGSGVIGKFHEGMKNAKDAWGKIHDTVPPAPEKGRPPTSDEVLARQLRAVQQSIGAFMSILSLPQDILNVAFADLTAPIAAIFPSLPASPILTPWLGIPHTHTHPPSLIPPAPPIPLPGLGPISVGICVKVLISGLPAARVGDYGMNFTCGSLTPVFEVFTGSSNVFIGGKRAARMGDIGVSCKPSIAEAAAGKLAGVAGKLAGPLAKIAPMAEKASKALAVIGIGATVVGGAVGVAADAQEAVVADTAAMSAAKGLAAAMDAAQLASDIAAIALGLMMGKDVGAPPCIGALLAGVPNVLIGGFPMINIPNPVEALLSVLAAFKPPPAKVPPGTEPCASEAQPINLVTGAFFDRYLDVELPGPPAFRWQRHYDTRWAQEDGPLGFGYRHDYQWELKTSLDGMTLITPRNERIPFPPFEAGVPTVHFDGFLLRRMDSKGQYLVTHHAMPERYFQQQGNSDVFLFVEQREEESWIRFSHDESRRLEQMSDSTGRKFRFRLDPKGRIIQIRVQEPDMKQDRMLLSFEYNVAGNLVRYTDGLKASGSHTYDAANRMVRRTDRRNYTFNNEYDAAGRCVREWGEDGLWDARVRYLPEANCAIATYSDGATTTVIYDESGTATDVIDPCGRKTKFIVGSHGRVEQEIDSLGNITRWLYDALGANVGRLTPLGDFIPPIDVDPNPPDPRAYVLPRTSLAWECGRQLRRDLLDQPANQKDPIFYSSLAPAFNAIFHTQAAGSPAAHNGSDTPKKTYDPLGRLIEVIDRDGHTRKWTHDAEGNIVEYVDRDGSVTRFNYKSWNLIHEAIDPMGRVTSYKHSVRTAITQIKDPNGNVQKFVYDGWDRLIEVHRHGRVRERYEYDAADNLLQKTDGENRRLLNIEIVPGNLKGARQLADGPKQTFAYDARGRITEAATETMQATFAYDFRGQMIHDLRDGAGVHHDFEGTRLVRTRFFERFVVRTDRPRRDALLITDPTGGTHAIQFAPGGVALKMLSSGRSELSIYDRQGRCLHKVGMASTSDRIAWHRKYRYSAEGDLLEVDNGQSGVIRYRYDASHRLVEEISGPTRREFRTDPAGNLLDQPGLAGAVVQEGNRLLRANGETFEYNLRNHISARTGAGRRTSYHYDAQDMLVRCDVGGETWTAEYDPLCRRTRKIWRGETTTYYWDDWRLAAEESSSGRLRIYVYIDEAALVPFLFIDYASREAEPSGGTVYFILTNQIGVPIRVENDRREGVWEAKFDPYGKAHVKTGNSVRLSIRFPGHYYDDETGLHYNRFRYYDPVLGRYLQSDPFGVNGGLNLYAYPSGPLTKVDIDGLNGHNPQAPGEDEPHSAGSDKEEKPVPPRTPEEVQADRVKMIQEYATPELLAKAEALKAGKDVTVSSQAEAEQVLLLAYPDAQDCGRSGPLHGYQHEGVDADGNPYKYSSDVPVDGRRPDRGPDLPPRLGPEAAAPGEPTSYRGPTDPLPYDQTGWSGTNPNGQYHTDYDRDPNTVNPETGQPLIYGHDADNPHGNDPHINVKRPDGTKGAILVKDE